MITIKICPVCKSNNIAKYNLFGTAPRVKHEIMPKVFVETAIISGYSECQKCHLIFQNPRLSEKELRKYYSEGYYRRLLNATPAEDERSELNRAKIDAELIGRYIKDIKSHLDIGSSRGFLLEEVGADIKAGVELNTASNKAKGIIVYPKLEDVPKIKFDLVTCIHVFEHVPGSVIFLKKMMRFVDKNGYLVLEVPTWKSPGGPLRLAHLYHFEPEVLKDICTKAGLKVLYELYTPHLILIMQVS